MSQPVYEPALLPPAMWLEFTEPGTLIHDYDGWCDQSFEQPVTLDDFQRRLSKCTLGFKAVKLAHLATFNINSRVKLKLTVVGLQIVERVNREIYDMVKRQSIVEPKYKPHYKVSSSGHLTMHMWEAFNVFGGENMPGVATSLDTPFETEIELIPN